jgi:hypothetical protein
LQRRAGRDIGRDLGLDRRDAGVEVGNHRVGSGAAVTGPPVDKLRPSVLLLAQFRR